jgi:hypothetical protein
MVSSLKKYEREVGWSHLVSVVSYAPPPRSWLRPSPSMASPRPVHPGVTHLMNVLCQALCMLGNSLRWTIHPAYTSECLNWILHLLPSRTQNDQQRPFAERREVLTIGLTHPSSLCGRVASLHFKRSDKSQAPNIPKRTEVWLGRNTFQEGTFSPRNGSGS